MAKSANLAFHVIAVQKKVLPKARLDTALRQAEEQGAAIEGVLLDAGNLDLAGIERIAAIREKHGRPCVACSKTTYLLPGETPAKPCEHCGGALAPAAGAAGAPPKGAPPPGAPPKGAPPAPKGPAPGGGPPPRGAGPPPKAAPKGAPVPRPAPKAPPGDEPSPYDPPAPPRPPAPAPSDEASFVDEAPDPEAAPAPTPTPVAAPAPAPVAAAAPEPAPVAAPAPAAAPTPAAAPRASASAETEEEKRARLLKMRRSGIVMDSTPEPPAPASPPPAAAPAPAPAPSVAPVVPKPMQVVGVGRAAAPAPPPADDDARFRPPGAARAPALPGAAPGPAPVPAGKLADEVPLILKLIASPRGLFMVSAAALVAFLLQVVLDFAQRMPLAFMGLGPLAPLFVYVQGYLVRVTEAATKGEGELPDWPELGEGAGLGLRLFAAGLSAFLPALLLGFAALDWSSAPSVRSIGPNAVDMAGKTPIVAPGTPAGEAAFLRPEGEVVPMTGAWTVLGLLGRDLVDDTGMSELMADMPSGMMGVNIDWGAQIQDLDRVALALKGKNVRVFAAYADPDCKILHERYPSALPRTMQFVRGRRVVGAVATPEPAGHGEEEDEDGEELPRGADPSGELGKAMDLGAKGTRAATGAGADRGPDGAPLEVKLQAVELLRTGDFAWPAPFAGLKRYPTVYVLDPSGNVRREYSAGVDDKKLYADVLDLIEGGNGDAKRRSLPAEAYGLKSKARSPVIQKVATIAFGALVLAGLFYYPMALLLTVVFTNASMGFRYPLAIGSIARTLPEYALVAGLFIGIDLLGGALGLGFDRALRNALPGWLATFLGGYSQAWLVMYGSTVCAWAMGRYYLRQQHELRWFAS